MARVSACPPLLRRSKPLLSAAARPLDPAAGSVNAGAVGKIALISLVCIAALYLLAFLFQRSLIYPAPRGAPPPVGAFPGFEEVRLETADGLDLRALYRPARAGQPTLIFFHGNGDSLGGAELATSALSANGYGLLLPEYRGYGGNPGAPTEAGLYLDGRAALRWLDDRGVPPDQTVLIGNSIGSGVAIQLATEQPVAGLVIVSGFTSLADVAAQHMWLFPVRLLLRDRYENRVKLARVRAPVLILHGTEDTLIPPTHGEALAGAASNTTLKLVSGTGHELAYLPSAQAAILRWLEGPIFKRK